uniref:Chemosensory protein 4 variant n=1 Tax=Bombyx mori TaxID=7091 RepID=H9C8L3_BOMMO|nr:chemosensory protein 4 variant [Bombyx mori]AFF18072.1 chemosensory protein 4 variant [Bombyx mori]
MFMLFIISFIIVPVLKCCGTETSTYTTQYDEVDIKEIMDNERLLVAYIGCLLDKNLCTPEGKELKRDIPDALQSDCNKCSDKQRENADAWIEFMIDNRPEDWTKLEERYNPDGSYRTKYLESKHNATSNVDESK